MAGAAPIPQSAVSSNIDFARTLTGSINPFISKDNPQLPQKIHTPESTRSPVIAGHDPRTMCLASSQTNP